MHYFKHVVLFAGIVVLYFFNACSNQFQSISKQKQSPFASCQGGIPVQKVAAVPRPSPFAEKKLHLDDSIGATATSQKLQSSRARYLALINNKCLENADDDSLARTFARNGRPYGGWSEQPYLLDQSGPELLSLETDIESDPCIIGVSPNRTYRTSALSDYLNDPQLELQGHLNSIQFEGALTEMLDPQYGLTNGKPFAPTIVAVIDTGVDYNHIELSDAIFRLPEGPGVVATTLGRNDTDPIYDGKDIDREVGHGTHVAGLIAAKANNAAGGSGLAGHAALILPINAFYFEDPDDPATLVSDSITIVKAIRFAVQRGAHIINMSLGGPGTDPAVYSAIQDAITEGVMVIASAGNISGNESAYEISLERPIFPAVYGAEFTGMLTVGSTDTSSSEKSYFSLYSPTIVEISAPGSQSPLKGLFSTTPQNTYSFLMGTSQAAPLVAGAAALAQSYYRHHYGRLLPPSILEELIVSSATKNAALRLYFKDGNQLNVSSLIRAIQTRFPGTVGGPLIDMQSCD